MPDRPFRAPLSFAIGCLMLVTTVAGLAVASPGAQSPPSADRPSAGECAAQGAKIAADQVVAGDPAWVRMNLDIACSPVTAPMHVVLVQDGSLAMSGTLKTDLHAQAAEVVRALRLSTNPTTLVGSVEYSDKARRLLELTNDEAAATAAVQRSGARGKTMIELGIDEAVKMIDEGRAAAGNPADLADAIILMANGRNEKGCATAINARNKARDKGILVMASCVGADCEADCMREIATTPRYFYFFDEDKEKLFGALHGAQRPVAVSVTDLAVSDDLAMPYQAGSGVPAPAFVSADRLHVLWRATAMPSEGLTITYDVETGPPPGPRPVSVAARASYTNSVGWSGTFVFPVPSVLVVPAVSPSPPAASPTPTATLAGATPTPPPPTVTLPATSEAGSRIFLPCSANAAAVGLPSRE